MVKMPLGTEVRLGLRHIVLDEDPAPPPLKDTAPNFGPMSIVAKRLDGLLLGMDVGLGPGDFVFDGDQATPRKKGTSIPPNFCPMSVVTKRLDIDQDATWYGRKPRPRRHCVRWGTTCP